MSPDLAEILALTERVQAAIDAGEWVRAGELDAQRRERLERLVARNREASETDLSAALEGLQRRTQQMIGTVHHHRRRVLREASTTRTGQAAAEAYGAASEAES